MRWKPLAVGVAVPLAVGGLSALITRKGMEAFAQVRQPPLAPPQWLFPVVWTALFILMGIASYLVYATGDPRRRTALTVYGVQLAVNFCWSIFFFSLGWYLFAFCWLVGLWLLIWAIVILFGRLSKAAAWLLVPYLVWVAFAGYLNLGVYLLNP